jgi:hypothetical protein
MHVFMERHRVVISIDHKQAEDLAGILADYEHRSENPYRCEMAGMLRRSLNSQFATEGRFGQNTNDQA